MNEHAEQQARPGTGQFAQGLDRVWSEIKQISKQVEQETRRSGQVARLRLDIRRLRREQAEVSARLGLAVYEASRSRGGETPLHEVEGYGGGVAALDSLHEQIAAKEQEIGRLRNTAAAAPADAPMAGADEVAEEPAGS